MDDQSALSAADDGFLERRSGRDRRRGRPPLFADSSHLTCRVEGALHDAYARLASERGAEISELVRDALERYLRQETDFVSPKV